MKKNISKKVKQNPATLTAELQNNPEFINLEKEIATSAQNKKKEVDEKVEQDLMKLTAMLRKAPQLLDRMIQIATLSQSDGEEISTVDQVESQLVKAVQSLGVETMSRWAKNAEEKQAEKVRKENPGVCQREKKTFRSIAFLEK